MKKVLSLVLAVMLILTAVPLGTFSVSAANSKFAAGNGTESDPYLIETKEHLNNVRNDLDAHYKMIADIEFTDVDFAEGGDFYNEGNGWEPIGDYPFFSGVFDGGGYSINNLYVNQDATSLTYVGLFGRNDGVVKNLGIKNVDITVTILSDCYANVGGVVGWNDGNISNCYTTGSINVKGTLGSGYAGGITGYNPDAIVRECYNAASIISTYSAGGVSGGNSDGSIINCFNIGMITALKNTVWNSAYAGGISGANGGVISCCYNIGYVTSEEIKGGITGIHSDVLNNAATINTCYYLDNISVGIGIGHGGTTKCTLDHIKRQDTFGGFDFDTVWTMVGDEDYWYPELINTPIDFTKQIQGITLASLPYKTEYYAGLEELDVTGGKIAIVYNDGTYTEVNLDESMVSGFDNSKVGTQTLTVNCNNEIVTFDIKVLALVYDYKLTTDEIITLEYSANCEYDFVLSDETVAEITNVQSTIIKYGSTIKVTSAATISPLKPGYTVVRVIDKLGNILTKSLLLFEEGNHQMQLSQVLKEVSCTQPGKELHICKFCGYQEEITIDSPGHIYDNSCDTDCNECGDIREIMHTYDGDCDDICNVCNASRTVTTDHTYTNSCDGCCDVCEHLRMVLVHNYSDCYIGYEENIDYYGGWNISSTTTGIFSIKPKTETPGFNFHSIAVFDKQGNEVKYYEKLDGFPLVKDQKYTVKFKYDCSDEISGKITWKLAKKSDTIFPDTSADGWYNDAVTYAVGAGIIGGYGNGKFGTSDSIQRQDFLVMLARLDGVELTSYGNVKSKFPDVAEGSYYEAAVNWGAQKGIVGGYDNGKFGTGDKITREQLVTFLHRYATYKGYDDDYSASTERKVKSQYSDHKNVSSFANVPILWAIEKGVIKGKNDTTIAPQGNAQRCEVAQIMYNIFLNDIFK